LRAQLNHARSPGAIRLCRKMFIDACDRCQSWLACCQRIAAYHGKAVARPQGARIYLVRNTQYQFFDCGVRYRLHVDARLALSQLWDWRVTWLRKRRRPRKQRRRRRPPRRSDLQTLLTKTNQGARPTLQALIDIAAARYASVTSALKPDRDTRALTGPAFPFRG
jgi:hypothetical protein